MTFIAVEVTLSEQFLPFGIPFDFVFFALTLVGIAIFHRHALPVALASLGAITAYKLSFTGFEEGVSLASLRWTSCFARHSHEVFCLSYFVDRVGDYRSHIDNGCPRPRDYRSVLQGSSNLIIHDDRPHGPRSRVERPANGNLFLRVPSVRFVARSHCCGSQLADLKRVLCFRWPLGA